MREVAAVEVAAPWANNFCNRSVADRAKARASLQA
jgi:hypothetical protein